MDTHGVVDPALGGTCCTKTQAEILEDDRIDNRLRWVEASK